MKMPAENSKQEDPDIAALLELIEDGKISRFTLRQFISTFSDDYRSESENMRESRSSGSNESSPQSSPSPGSNVTKDPSDEKSLKRGGSPIVNSSKRRRTTKSDAYSDDSGDFYWPSTSDSSGVEDSYEESGDESPKTKKICNSDRKNCYHVTVEDILKKYTIGPTLIRSYQQSGALTNPRRKCLAGIIIQELMAKNYLIERTSELERLAHEIHDIFPTERVMTYYVKSTYSWDGKLRPSRGMLVNKYRWERRKHMKSVCSSANLPKKETRSVTVRRIEMRNTQKTLMELNYPLFTYLGLARAQTS